MKKYIFTLLGLLALSWLAAAADIDGKWTAQVGGRVGGKGAGKGGQITETLMLKANGGKLTGSIQRRRGAAEISDGTISGSDVSFKVAHESASGKRNLTQQYKGTLSGGQLKLTVTGPRGGTRDLVFTKSGS